MIRLQKYIANAGIASRRGAEKIIAEGRVTVNGEIIREMGVQIDENYDTLRLTAKKLKVPRKSIISC